MEEIRLTQFSPGAGCGCKISPKDLERILKSDTKYPIDKRLIVGNESKDDAAVLDLGNGTALISTTDFFTPIVDNPFDFGRIAATNAISDIYAMGGKPILAIALLGWPLEKLPAELAGEVLEGAREVCFNAGIQLAGGHSIDISDPIFGLAVNGIVSTENIKQNNKAEVGCKLFLTKPLGIGIITTAEKRGKIQPEDAKVAVNLMTTLNKAGETFGKLDYITAMTDVTGFGFLGHLLEMCEGSNVNAKVYFDKVPKIKSIETYLELKTFPGGTFRNFNSYGNKIAPLSDNQKHLLCDPQTSGGLLVAVKEDKIQEFKEVALQLNLNLEELGELLERKSDKYVYIEVI